MLRYGKFNGAVKLLVLYSNSALTSESCAFSSKCSPMPLGAFAAGATVIVVVPQTVIVIGRFEGSVPPDEEML